MPSAKPTKQELQKRQENEFFILRILDALRDHTDPHWPTETELDPKRGIWQATTPAEFLEVIQITHEDRAEAELMERIHEALRSEKLDRALFLILVLARLPAWGLHKDQRLPFGLRLPPYL